MTLDAKKASEMQSDNYFRGLLYGSSGAGKTTLGARFMSNPLILLTEPNGLPSIRTSNPNASVIQIASVDEFDAAIRDITIASRGGKLQYDAIVLDSLTDLQEKYAGTILSKSKANNLTLQEWGWIIDRGKQIVRNIRALPCHSLVICLAGELEIDNAMVIRPMLFGRKLPIEVVAYFSYCVFLQVEHDKTKGKFIRRLITQSGDKWLTKGHVNWKPIMPPDFAKLWELANEPTGDKLNFTGE